MPADGGPAERITFNGGGRAAETENGLLIYSRPSARGPGFVSLWKKAAQEQKDELLISDVFSTGWTVSGNRLWHIAPAESGAELRYLDIGAGNYVRAGGFPAPTPNEGSLSVSRDGRFALYIHNDNPGSDLMIVEQFR